MTSTETLHTYPLTQGEQHSHVWRPLSDLDGVHRSYWASYCTLCGETQID